MQEKKSLQPKHNKAQQVNNKPEPASKFHRQQGIQKQKPWMRAPAYNINIKMLKYTNSGIVFQEIPDEVTLSINISNCPCHCPGCHSSYLWEDKGSPLDECAIDKFIVTYGEDITCICLMGGDAEPQNIDKLAKFIKRKYNNIKVGWYSGKSKISDQIDKDNFDYIKIGPYIQHLGGLKSPKTNQRLYKRKKNGEYIDITNTFWKVKA